MMSKNLSMTQPHRPSSTNQWQPENFKRNLLFKMQKLSNKGWSYH